MFAKFGVFFLLMSVIYARQILNVEDLSDPIDDLLKRLEEVIDRAVDDARTAINDARFAANKTAADVEAVTANALKGIEKQFRDELDELKAKAKAAGVNVDECFGQDETTLLGLPEVAAKEMVKCAEGYLLKVFNDADDALIKIQKAADDLTEIKKSIEKCNKDQKCLDDLAVKIEREIVTLPGEIGKDINEVIKIVSNIETEIEKCGTDAIEQTQTKGKQLLAKITDCVLGKIKH